MTRPLVTPLASLALVLVTVAAAWPHTIYMMNDNHTDYGWNATVATYESAMADELDFYLDRADATAGNAPEEQARFNGDNWYYLWLYEHHRTPAQLDRLFGRMRDGHITFPLNPLVELYGALPTEAAIRAGYYPARMARAHGLQFLLAQQEENATVPWGVVQLWASSGAKYTWRSVCECFHQAPYGDRTDEVFRWQGPDASELLMKWYQPPGDTGQTWGGYAEMRANQSPAALQTAIDRFSARAPFVPLTGLFGAGWDDVSWKTDALWQLAQTWNATHVADRAVASNGVDYFQDLEAYRSQLATVRGGWGNDWDAWPAKLAAKVGRSKRAVEKARAAEALAAIADWAQPGFWAAHQATMEAGWLSLFKVFEHNWADGGVGVASIVANKETWTSQWEAAVDGLWGDAAAVLGGRVRTPADEDRVLVFNPLGFARTDVVDVPVAGSGPWVVTDVATGAEVPSQVVGTSTLRFLAAGVPSVGYRVYRYAAGTGTAWPPAAVVTTTGGGTIDDGRYRVTLGSRGEIVSLVDAANGSRQLAGSALNDFGTGTAGPPAVGAVGPVSATLVVGVSGSPNRRVSVTLYAGGVDRVEIEDEILQNWTDTSWYRFAANLPSPRLHFEEVGAVARPGLVSQGGDFQPGTRADVMTLNHFVEWEGSGYEVTLSNRDALDFRPGASTPHTFDLGTAEVNVLALGIVTPVSGDITTQGNDGYFRHGFALRGRPGAWSGADAMRWSLAHQNPLVGIAVPRGQTAAPLVRPVRSFLGVDAADVVVTAVKPVEESGRGILLRLWELDGVAANATVSVGELGVTGYARTTLNETDAGAGMAPSPAGTFPASLAANALHAYRVLPGAFGDGTPTTTVTTTTSTTSSTVPHPCTTSAQCDDTNACNGAETCQSGFCAGGVPLSCGDTDLCTADGCAAQTGCVHAFQGVPVSIAPRAALLGLGTFGAGRFNFRGGITLPYPFTPSLDPPTGGVAAQLMAADGRVLAGFRAPAGAGWVRNATGRRWRYRKTSGVVRSASVRVTPNLAAQAAAVRLSLGGRNATFSATPADGPFRLEILPGSVPSQCGSLQFSGSVAPCRFNASGTVLRCG